MKNRFGAAFWGILLIILGIILGGNVLNLWDIEIFFPGWWTLFIIVPCLYSIVKGGFHAANTVGLLLGIVFLCSSWEILPWHFLWKMAIPCLLVLIGISLVAGKRNRNRNEEVFRGDTGKISAFCSGQELRIEQAPYRGGVVSATLGGVELDLRNAVITEDISVQARSFMGGIEISFPKNVRVEVVANPFLGSVENKTASVLTAQAPTVFVECRPVLGGIELK